MNRKQSATLRQVFTDPAPANVRWTNIESLLRSVIKGAGSAIQFECNGVIARFHRPHPGNEAKRYQVRDAREFLTKVGVKP
ncbi:MAG TPA: type II toxin-antitoxin system HicA family toxin [Caulobacteraceae bacterium]|jgi:hypothetical protein